MVNGDVLLWRTPFSDPDCRSQDTRFSIICRSESDCSVVRRLHTVRSESDLTVSPLLETSLGEDRPSNLTPTHGIGVRDHGDQFRLGGLRSVARIFSPLLARKSSGFARILPDFLPEYGYFENSGGGGGLQPPPPQPPLPRTPMLRPYSMKPSD